MGLISSIGLPILCCWFIHTNFNQKIHVVEIQNWNPKLHKEYSYYPKESHPKRNYISLELNGNDKEDSTTLSLAQLLIRQQNNNKDSVNGVHIIFSRTSELWAFIQLIDICYIEKAKSFSSVGYDFWVFNLDRQLPHKIFRMMPK